MFFIIVPSPSSPCQLLVSILQAAACSGGVLVAVIILPCHPPLCLPHYPCHWLSAHFVVVLIHDPPYGEVLIAVV